MSTPVSPTRLYLQVNQTHQNQVVYMYMCLNWSISITCEYFGTTNVRLIGKKFLKAMLIIWGFISLLFLFITGFYFFSGKNIHFVIQTTGTCLRIFFPYIPQYNCYIKVYRKFVFWDKCLWYKLAKLSHIIYFGKGILFLLSITRSSVVFKNKCCHSTWQSPVIFI